MAVVAVMLGKSVVHQWGISSLCRSVAANLVGHILCIWPCMPLTHFVVYACRDLSVLSFDSIKYHFDLIE